MKSSFWLLLLISLFSFSQATDSLFSELDEAIAAKSTFDARKRRAISEIRKNNGGLQPYYVNKALFEEYRKFRLDSAVFIRRNIEIASSQKNKDLRETAMVELANLYSSSGRYRESEDLLKSIDQKMLSPDLLPEYFETYSQFFEHYNTHSPDERYIKGIETYRDSLLSVLDPESLKYRINRAQADMYRQRYEVAWRNLQALVSRVDKDSPSYAMVSFLMGDICRLRGEMTRAKSFYIASAIADIKSSVKDNASMQMLAAMAYDEGDIDQAYRFTRSAIEDAIFCNAKFRTIGSTPFYNVINEAYQEKERRRNAQLRTYLILISILSVLLIGTLVFGYRQMRKLSRTRSALSESARKLGDLNDDILKANVTLQERNSQLFEANHVKEEYIAIFFDLCSSYINKIENYRKTLFKLATARQTEQLLAKLRSTTIVEQELEELYHHFDSIFLNLYPTFVDDFNALLLPEERIVLKPGELLNTELRIFALIRLGITDSVKIAAFLRYSLSTIYNYRTRARNRSLGSRDAFENEVSTIGNSGIRP